MVGDVLIAQEDQGILWHVRWNGTSFDKEELTRVELWEHVTFSTAGIAEIPVLPPTTTDGSGLSPVLLATAGLLAVLLAGGGAVFWAQRRRQAAAGAAIALPTARRPELSDTSLRRNWSSGRSFKGRGLARRRRTGELWDLRAR